MALRRSRYLALLTSLALVSPATALAGPDDGKTVATGSHVDSPKTFWADNNFALKSEFRGAAHELSDVVTWVGKGWASNGTNQYQFTLPEGDQFDFLGQPGQTFYTAPANIHGSHDPIWLGFGADAGLPVDQFRNGTASLDLLAVDGPGEVEMFSYYDGPAGLHRLLGTSESSPHSAYLSAGTHTHNYTAFSKPGRYELTYRTTARGKDGSLIASEPKTTSIQVGGMQPADAPTPSLQERYDTAPAGDSASLQAAGYSLSIAPKAQPEKDGDDNLHTVEFASKQQVNGTLTLLIDGYHLTDIPVKDGTARWEEFFGPLDSQIQAVFTPESSAAAEGSAQAPRWISQPLSYTHGATLEANSADPAATAESWSEPTGGRRTLAPQAESNVGDKSITARIEKAGETTSKVVVDSADKNYSGFIRGGFFAADSEYPDLDFTGSITNGHGEFLVDDEGMYDGDSVRLDIVSHPTVTEAGTTLTLTDNYEFGTAYDKKGQLGNAASESTAPSAPTTTEQRHSESVEPTTSAAQPQPAGQCESKLVLDHGHVDIKATGDAKGLSAVLKDETAIHESKTVERSLDDVVLAVHDNARVSRPSALSGSEFDFVGKQGSKFYLLPQTQQQTIIWPGYNTQDLNYADFDGGVDLTFNPVEVPEGATWGLFLSKGLSEQEVLMDSTKSDHTLNTTFAAHTHTNWAFSTPGTYTFEVNYSARTKDGKQLRSTPQTLTLAVGDAAIKDCTSPAPAETTEPAPANPVTTTPTTATKPAPTTAPTTSKPAPTTTATSAKPAPTTTPSPEHSEPGEPGKDNGGDKGDAQKPGGSSAVGISPWVFLAPLGVIGVLGAIGAFFALNSGALGAISDFLPWL